MPACGSGDASHSESKQPADGEAPRSPGGVAASDHWAPLVQGLQIMEDEHATEADKSRPSWQLEYLAAETPLRFEVHGHAHANPYDLRCMGMHMQTLTI